MTPDSLFQICNTIVLPAWLLLMIAPKWQWTSRIVVGIIVIPLCIVYLLGISETIMGGGLDFASFGSLQGVMALFTEPAAVLVGWVHYLAFDLLVGWLIVQNAIKHGVNHLLVVPCLLLTFMLGPTGFLLYWIIRTIKVRAYFPTKTT